jgi:alkanesulfonate monooxygenase SsuD/methylene tetrahydromethanopterin reductase-like flavin-dependent oxidoreductase (luciferase family)
MKHWFCVMFEDNSQLCDITRAAEAVGYHGIAVADHVAHTGLLRVDASVR